MNFEWKGKTHGKCTRVVALPGLAGKYASAMRLSPKVSWASTTLEICNLRDMLLKDVSHIGTAISKLPANHGGAPLGYASVHRQRGFVWWVKDHQHRGQVANEDDLGPCFRTARTQSIIWIWKTILGPKMKVKSSSLASSMTVTGPNGS